MNIAKCYKVFQNFWVICKVSRGSTGLLKILRKYYKYSVCSSTLHKWFFMFSVVLRGIQGLRKRLLITMYLSEERKLFQFEAKHKCENRLLWNGSCNWITKGSKIFLEIIANSQRFTTGCTKNSPINSKKCLENPWIVDNFCEYLENHLKIVLGYCEPLLSSTSQATRADHLITNKECVLHLIVYLR